MKLIKYDRTRTVWKNVARPTALKLPALVFTRWHPLYDPDQWWKRIARQNSGSAWEAQSGMKGMSSNVWKTNNTVRGRVLFVTIIMSVILLHTRLAVGTCVTSNTRASVAIHSVSTRSCVSARIAGALVNIWNTKQGSQFRQHHRSGPTFCTCRTVNSNVAQTTALHLLAYVFNH